MEHNGYSGFEYQPSARVLWLPNHLHALWAAVSRPVRTPARNDQDVRIAFRAFPSDPATPGSTPVLTRLYGERSFGSEKLLAYELGYRLRPTRALLLDAAEFYNDYSELRATLVRFGPQTGGEIPHIELIYPDANLMDGTTYGGELAVEWQADDGRKRLRGAYAMLQTDFDIPPMSDPESANAESVAPEHQLSAWASIDLPRNVALDVIGRYVGDIRDHGTSNDSVEAYLPDRNIDAYAELDVRLAWQLEQGLEVYVSGRNLLADRHPEFAGFFLDTLPTETRRRVHVGGS